MAGTISSTDVHSIQRHNVGHMTDMISDLPEGILLHILTKLRTKAAVRTSILSKKWKHLWTYLSVFDFEVCQNQNSANRLVDQVGSLLQKSNRVERLGISILRATIDADKVSSLISSASKHKLQSLKLSLGDQNDKFMFPHSFSAFASLNHLYLGLKFTLHIPSGIHFPSLKTLGVCDVTFANEVSAQRLFSGCPVLEDLSLYNCFLENIEQISIGISTLKKLNIDFDRSCVDYDHDMTIKIDAVNLLSLSCTCNPTIEFIPVNLTSLVNAFIHLGNDFPFDGDLYAAHCVIQLLRGLSSVESLIITNDTLECLNFLTDALHLLPSFHNLTHLEVFYFSWIPPTTSDVLTYILRKTPKVEVLEIPGVVLDHLNVEDSLFNSAPCCLKSSLKRLCILSFFGDEHEIEFLRFVLKNATFLREIRIFCSTCLLAIKNKVDDADVWNPLQPVGMESCVINYDISDHYREPSSDDEFFYSESSDDESSEYDTD